MNSYEACSHHINGHLPYCCLCQEESLRDLLRQVANSDAVDAIQKVLGLSGGGCMTVFIKKELWEKLLPLRNTATNKEG